MADVICQNALGLVLHQLDRPDFSQSASFCS